MAELTPAMQAMILHWGEMGSRWGLNRSAAQILILLHLSPEPLSAGEISTTLGLARSNVSAGLKELHTWQVIEGSRRLGDRKEYFTAPRDLTQLARAVIAARHDREVVPYRAQLETQLAAARTDGTPAAVTARLAESARVMDALDAAVRSALDEALAGLALAAAEAPEETAPEAEDLAEVKPKKKKKKSG